ncbi:MAG TPA: hypothetical protein VFV50_04325 [Bdellovibrionales bacterium]|nr:hypothetical protein [Bdellovibrionales bacterium]
MKSVAVLFMMSLISAPALADDPNLELASSNDTSAGVRQDYVNEDEADAFFIAEFSEDFTATLKAKTK